MGLDFYGSSSDGVSLWGSTEDTFQLSDLRRYLREMSLEDATPSQRSNSMTNISSKPVDAVMQEFRMNGSDSPYDPEEDDVWGPRPGRLSGMGPASAYLRQKSWPAPDASPAAPPPPLSAPGGQWAADTWRHDVPASSLITPEQQRVLASLPGELLYAWLRDLSEQHAANKPTTECRLCKNNGERESYYRSHPLKDAAGRVRCPVLRAFTCRRCGARGDDAHTLKYCPLTTDMERQKSAAMMRSVRLASGRRRLAPSAGGAAPLLEAPPGGRAGHLDPVWAALEQKLME